MTAPTRKTRRIPKRSPSRPPKTISAASGRMLAVISHCDCEIWACRPTIACGAASGTAVWSTRIIELASVIAASVIFMLRREVILAAGQFYQGSRSAISARRGAALSRSESSGSSICHSTPIAGVVPGDPGLGGRVVQRGHLVADVGDLAQHREAVAEADRDEELAVLLVVEDVRLPLPVGRRVACAGRRRRRGSRRGRSGPASPGRARSGSGCRAASRARSASGSAGRSRASTPSPAHSSRA